MFTWPWWACGFRSYWALFGLHVEQDSSLGDGGTTKQLVELFDIAESPLEVSGDDVDLLVVAGGVAGQLKYLSLPIIKGGDQIDGSSGPDSLHIVALPEQMMNMTDWELQTSDDPSLGLVLNLASLFTTSWQKKHSTILIETV